MATFTLRSDPSLLNALILDQNLASLNRRIVNQINVEVSFLLKSADKPLPEVSMTGEVSQNESH